MAESLETLRIWIEQLIVALGYPGIALIMLLENLFPPIPSELVMPFAGFLASEGDLSFMGVVIAGTVGALLGALALYWIGERIGERRIRALIEAYGPLLMVSPTDLDRALNLFQRYGIPTVFFARLIPLVRSLISVPAGLNRMPLLPFIIFTTIGSLLWNLLLAYGGYLLGASWSEIMGFVKEYERVVLVVGAMVIGFFALRLIQRRFMSGRRTTSN